jgi:hypothetical protein
MGAMSLLGLLGSLSACSSLSPAPIDYGPIRSGRFSLSGPGLQAPLVGQFEWRQASGPARQRLWLSDPWMQPQGSLMLMSDGSGPWAGWQPLGPQDQVIDRHQAAEWAHQTLGLTPEAMEPLGRLLTELGEQMLTVGPLGQAQRLHKVMQTPKGELALRLFVESQTGPVR